MKKDGLGKIKHLSKEAQEQIRKHLDATASPSKSKANKYGAKKTVSRDGLKFDSRLEYKRWNILILRERAGEIRGLKRQVAFTFPGLVYDSGKEMQYVADFVYEERTADGGWVQIVEDVKGHRTREYLMKKALMRRDLGIFIRET